MQIKMLVLVTANAICIAIACVLILLFFTFGPSFEPYVFGRVVAFGTPLNIYRDTKIACFDLPIRKLHAAKVVKYEFYAETELSPEIGLSAYIADKNHQRTNEELLSHKVGAGWVRSYCFELPGTIADSQAMTITGNAQHARHPFWTTVTPIPPFRIPPLS